jgi:hypothetical protein
VRAHLEIALVITVLLAIAAGGQAQTAGGGAAPYGYQYSAPPPSAAYYRAYRFSDEPVMSINRSYLGYSNLEYSGPGLPAHANPPPRGGYVTGYAAPRAPVYAPAPASAPAPVYYVPARRGPFRWLRGYR